MKKLAFLLLTIIFLALPVCANAFVIEYDGLAHEYDAPTCTLMVNNEKILTPDMPPLLLNDRTLVPVRELCEALGAVVSYGNGNIMIDLEGDVLEMTINENRTYFNGRIHRIHDGVTPKLINLPEGDPKTMVPVRFIAEIFGKYVGFDQNTYTVIINNTAPESIQQEPVQQEPVQQEPVQQPVQQPEPIQQEQAQPAPVYPSKIPTILSVSYTLEENNKQITLKILGDSLFTAGVSSFTLTDPTRVVFDFPGSDNSLPASKLTIKDSPITAVRFGYDGNRTRAVVDISGTVSGYVATQDGVYTTIIVSTNGAPAPKAPAPTTNTQQVQQQQQQQSAAVAPPVAQDPSVVVTPIVPAGTPITVPDSYDNLAKKIIVIDAGHGGTDSGAVSSAAGRTLNEKDLTLSVALKTRDILTNRGYNVVMTRATDVYPTLAERAELANRNGAAIFVSIHMNSSTASSAKGTETYYSVLNNWDHFGPTSASLASNIQTRLQSSLGSKDRGVKTANHAVTKNSLMPAALVEVGFISNSSEASLLASADYQNKAALAIAEGIITTHSQITMPSNWDNMAIERYQLLN